MCHATHCLCVCVFVCCGAIQCVKASIDFLLSVGVIAPRLCCGVCVCLYAGLNNETHVCECSRLTSTADDTKHVPSLTNLLHWFWLGRTQPPHIQFLCYRTMCGCRCERSQLFELRCGCSHDFRAPHLIPVRQRSSNVHDDYRHENPSIVTAPNTRNLSMLDIRDYHPRTIKQFNDFSARRTTPSIWMWYLHMIHIVVMRIPFLR